MAQTIDGLHALKVQLDLLIRLLAVQIAESKETQAEKVEILDRAGLTPMMIAKVCGTTRNTVSVRLHAVRRKKKKPSDRLNKKK